MKLIKLTDRFWANPDKIISITILETWSYCLKLSWSTDKIISEDTFNKLLNNII